MLPPSPYRDRAAPPRTTERPRSSVGTEWVVLVVSAVVFVCGALRGSFGVGETLALVCGAACVREIFAAWRRQRANALDGIPED